MRPPAARDGRADRTLALVHDAAAVWPRAHWPAAGPRQRVRGRAGRRRGRRAAAGRRARRAAAHGRAPALLRALLGPIQPVYDLTDPRLAFRGIKGCELLLRRVLGDFVRATLCFWPDRAVSRWLDRVKTDNDRESSDNSLIQASAFADFSDATGEADNDHGHGDGYGNGGVG